MPYSPILAFVWQHIKPYKWLYLIMMMAPLVGAFYPFAYNYAIKLFLDAMETQEQLQYSSILLPIVLFLGAQFILDLVWRISDIAAWKSEPFVRRSILLKSYDYVQHHSYEFFQNNFTGAISSKLKGLLDGYDKFWSEVHRGIMNKIFEILVNLTALATINLKLGLFVFIWTAVYVPIMYKLSIKLNTLAFDETESKHRLTGQISDKITNIISLFSFASRTREYRTLSQQITSDFIPRQLKVYRYNFKVQLIGGFLYVLMYGFILFFMIHLRMQQSISIGDFAFVFGMSLVIGEGIWKTTVSMQDFARAMGDFKSALSILETPQQNIDTKGAQSLIIKTPRIEFKQVYFGYDKDHMIIKDLNLIIQPGEKVGLVGHSGAGKSSLINLLLRYFENDQGQILIDGQDINEVTQDSLRENIAVIPQDTLLFHRSLQQNIQYGKADASDAEVIEASKKAHIHEFIETLPQKYDTFVGERGIKLSGGQRQRVAIARAILKDAPILILDEATASLDSQTEKLIQESLNFLIEDKRKTVIAIAHRLSTLKHMDRIIVLEKGKIVEEGNHNTLVANDKSLYKQLWKLQEIRA